MFVAVDDYDLETMHEEGVALQLDKAIDSTGVFEFFLLRRNSK